MPKLVSTSNTSLGYPHDPSSDGAPHVVFPITENDNLRHEYSALFDQVQRDIPFARIALEKDPDAINMWYVKWM